MIDDVHELSQQDIRIVKGVLVAGIWFVSLFFMGAGWAAAIFAVAAAAAWLCGSSWMLRVGSIALIVAMLVQLAIIPPAANWHEAFKVAQGQIAAAMSPSH